MFTTVLDQLTGALEKRFLLNAFFPMLIFSLALGLSVAAGADGVLPAIESWEGLDGGIQVLLVIAAAGLIFVAANILANATHTIISLFEGYLPPASWFGRRACDWQLWRARKLLDDDDPRSQEESLDRFQRTFPVYPDPLEKMDVAPTRLGNVLRSAETYPKSRYGVDAVRFWPRLFPLIEDPIVSSMVASRTSMEFLLCVSFLAGLYTLVASVVMILMAAPTLWIYIALGVGTVVSFASYFGALGPASTYGEQVRTAYDLYRLELIRKLNYPLPATLAEEHRTWAELTLFLDRGTPGKGRRFVLGEE
ncbi:MAG: hypothetical protein QOE75_1773 [Solirubrobacterales bacterium]|jgi:hypothetical protein|nr:hypothetical protein [Solirubrobacterales bacterium]